MDCKTASSNSIGPGMSRVGWSGWDDILAGCEEDSLRIWTGDTERLRDTGEVGAGREPDRCWFINDKRDEGLVGCCIIHDEGLPLRWGMPPPARADLEALRIWIGQLLKGAAGRCTGRAAWQVVWGNVRALEHCWIKLP